MTAAHLSGVTTVKPEPYPIEWWTIVYGEDEAITALSFPEELRQKLYPIAVKYGPASEAINTLLNALRAAKLHWNVSNPKMTALEAVQRALIGEENFRVELAALTNEFTYLSRLSMTLYRAYPHDTFKEAIWVTCWLLNGPFLFTDNLWQRSEHLVEPVNKFLKTLSLPALEQSTR